ncbi:hypothetical protein BDV30DRAFT_237296 [Aspergillus minisclerotigenes]|uniref:Uncharacterized protein n=1 Tax=Aspergillus minisclerotigenes TaxID=656917 RepID=A0A5N6JA78_9EURO|nr:hypothetical protein BDV30DRAFT_237296 [Aspergillus minisclerotigenes]
MEGLGVTETDLAEEPHGGKRAGPPKSELNELAEILTAMQLRETARASDAKLKWSKIVRRRAETDVQYRFLSISLPESKRGVTQILLAIGGTRHCYQAAQQVLSLFNLDGPFIIRAEQIYHLHSLWTNTPYNSVSSDPEIHFASLSFRPYFDDLTGQMTQELSCITASIPSMETLVGILIRAEKMQFREDAQNNFHPEASISAVISAEVNDAAEMFPSAAAVQMENVGNSIQQVDWDLTGFFGYTWETLNKHRTSTELLDSHGVPDMPSNREIWTNPLHGGMLHPSSNGPEMGTEDSPDDANVRKRRKHSPLAKPSCTVMTGSSHAIATLREFVYSYQTEEDFRHWQVGPTVPPQMRFNIIEELDSKISLYGLLRRYHILHFYVECVPTNSRALTNFIGTDPNDFQRKSKVGNPSHNAKSEVTLLMIREMYPDIDLSSLEYKSKYRAVSKLQTLGRRYLSLTDRFGKGVLGLLPPSNLTNSDNMILSLSDSVFGEFVNILEDSQRDILKSFSDAAFSVLEPLLYGASQGFMQSHISSYAAKDIIRCPQGSDELLTILSSPQNRVEHSNRTTNTRETTHLRNRC